jgi:hypothetical protein
MRRGTRGTRYEQDSLPVQRRPGSRPGGLKRKPATLQTPCWNATSALANYSRITQRGHCFDMTVCPNSRTNRCAGHKNMRSASQRLLPFGDVQPTSIPEGTRAIEADNFPFEAISKIAERESWRKEINRPVYHVHKWWAQRLGSVFRAIILGGLCPPETDLVRAFYSKIRFPGAVVFDPFMGSGTTTGEALKLGCRAIGRDINPVAYFLVRNALE